MAKFTIWETVVETFEIEADSAQEALDQFLQAGAKAQTCEVRERFVTDAAGQEVEVEES